MLKAILIDDDYRDREILELLVKNTAQRIRTVLETKPDLILQL